MPGQPKSAFGDRLHMGRLLVKVWSGAGMKTHSPAARISPFQVKFWHVPSVYWVSRLHGPARRALRARALSKRGSLKRNPALAQPVLLTRGDTFSQLNVCIPIGATCPTYWSINAIIRDVRAGGVRLPGRKNHS